MGSGCVAGFPLVIRQKARDLRALEFGLLMLEIH